jgi:hypothetical protein
LTITWTGAGTVTIRGGNMDYPTNSAGEFICSVPAGATSFTVPSYVLAPLPGTRSNYSLSHGFIELHSVPAGSPQSITAGKLTGGAAQVDFIDRRSALYK